MTRARDLAGLGSAAEAGLMFRNRLINGDMRIDQRNAGASGTGNNNFTVDRFVYTGSQSGKFTWQQNQGGVTPPSGFTNYLGLTVASGYTVLSGDYFGVGQTTEGYTIADLAWGTNDAKPVTLSFWVNSSITGIHGGALRGASTQSYPFTYTINSANTWEYKTITIPGATSGTWGSTNGAGVFVHFGLGVGSTYTGPAGAWAAQNYLGANGTVSVVGTTSATWRVTGVQLESGTVATPFERRPYGTELALCQRYYEKSYDVDKVPSNLLDLSAGCFAQADVTTRCVGATGAAGFRVSKRALPTVTIYSYNGTAGRVSTPDTGNTLGTNVAAGRIAQNGFGQLGDGAAPFTVGQWYWFGYTASAEL